MEGPTINTTPRRLRILGDEEIAALYGLPHLTDDERLEYFALSPSEKAAMEQLHSLPSQIYFLLQLGYFKSHQMFFVFTFADVAEDTKYIQTQHFPHAILANVAVTKVTRLRQQRLILGLFHYRSCDATQRHALVAKAQQAAMISVKPIYIFRELMHYLKEQRIVAPGYSLMQDTVGQALTHEQARLATVVSTALDLTAREALDRLLADGPGLYAITQLRHEPKDFSAQEIKREIQRGEHIRDLYRLAQRVLPQLAISNESIKYYASLVSYYSVYKLKRFQAATTYLYLLCFVSHRYQRLHDHLLSSLIHRVRRYTDEAKEAAKDRVYEHRVAHNEDVQQAGAVLKLFTDDRIAQSTPFQDVQAQAFALLERQKIDFVAEHLTKHARFDETAFQWAHLDTLAQQFKLRVRPFSWPWIGPRCLDTLRCLKPWTFSRRPSARDTP